MTYCFYVIMGGFVTNCSAMKRGKGSVIEVQQTTLLGMHLPWTDESSSRTLNLTEDHLVQLAERGRFLHVSSKTIMDKSKEDLLAKGLTICQVSWLTVQLISRKAQGLPLTLFELHTISHVVAAIFLYTFWWYKPKDIGSATLIPTAALQSDLEEILISYDKEEKEHDRPSKPSKSSDKGAHVYFLASFYYGCILFGTPLLQIACTAVHMAACSQWGASNYHFPSRIEATLWMASGYTLMGSTGFVLLEMAIGCLLRKPLIQWGYNPDELGSIRKLSKPAQVFWGCLFVLWVLVHIPIGPLIFSSRLYLIVESFISLRSIPLEAYILPEWTTYLPHF